MVDGRLGLPNKNIDWFIFISSIALVVLVCVPLALFPDQGRELLDRVFGYVTDEFGIVYVLMSIATMVFLGYLAFGRFGHVLLGSPGKKPDFSTFSWAAMLFCGGIGTSVLYWGTVEWAHYYTAPPFELLPRSDDALRWSVSYPIFHWGFVGWGLYCLPAIAIGYAYHVRKVPSLRLSAACAPVLGKSASGPLGRFIDMLFIVGLLGAASTGIGLAIPLISACLTEMFGVAPSFSLNVAVIAVITALFAVSVYVGLEKGIKRLSNVNVTLAFLLILFVLAVGPTAFILELGTESIGLMLQNFLLMSTATDVFSSGTFVESWTVFYWAWWLALGPFMGMFITKISGGRTIRQVVLGTLGYGTLGCTLFFVVLGSYAVFLEMNDIVDVVDLVGSDDAPLAIVAVLRSLPFGDLVLAFYTVVCLIFAATTYDSASYTLASSATRSLPADEHPERWNRVFWAFTIGVLPFTPIYIGGLRSLQSAVVAVSVPLLFVVVVMSVGLMKSLMADEVG